MNAVILQNDLAKLAEWEQLWGMEFHHKNAATSKSPDPEN